MNKQLALKSHAQLYQTIRPFLTSDASSIYLEVDSDTQWVDTNTAIPGNSSGIATVQLCVNQSPFVSHNESPYYFLSVNNDSSNSVTITDVIICFNQPDTGGCP